MRAAAALWAALWLEDVCYEDVKDWGCGVVEGMGRGISRGRERAGKQTGRAVSESVAFVRGGSMKATRRAVKARPGKRLLLSD